MLQNPLVDEYARVKRRRLHVRDEALVRPIEPIWKRARHATSKRGLEDGHARMREIRRVVARISKVFPLTQQQAEILEMGIRACAPAVYTREVFDAHQMEILRVNRWKLKDMNMWILISAARRLGKTFSMVVLVCAMLMVIPELKLAVFATAFEQAKKLLEEVERLFIKCLPEANFEFSKSNGKATLRTDARGDVRVAYACSSNTNVRSSLSRSTRTHTFFTYVSSRLRPDRPHL